MEITFDKQAVTDFDWFGVDEEGLLGHFATAGFKRLPASVANSAEDLQLVADFFVKHAQATGSHKVDENSLRANRSAHWEGDKNESQYLLSFVSMADKGFFSFDIASYLTSGDYYFRVACPEVPLPLGTLPDNIRQIVSRTVLRRVRLKDQTRVSYEESLSF